MTASRRLLDAPAGATLVAFVNDGEKYLGTVFDDESMAPRGLFDPEIEERVGALLDELEVPA